MLHNKFYKIKSYFKEELTSSDTIETVKEADADNTQSVDENNSITSVEPDISEDVTEHDNIVKKV